MKHINMETFANGAFTEQINRELKKVTENIQDPNTDATAKRKITVMIEFKPNEARNFVTTGVQANLPGTGSWSCDSPQHGQNIRTNEVEAVEIGSQIPGQMTIEEVTDSFDERGKTPRQVDPSTGEIIEQAEHSDNVIDLRARQA